MAVPPLVWRIVAAVSAVLVAASLIVFIYVGFEASTIASYCEGLTLFLCLEAAALFVAALLVGCLCSHVRQRELATRHHRNFSTELGYKPINEASLLGEERGLAPEAPPTGIWQYWPTAKVWCCIPSAVLLTLVALVLAWLTLGMYSHYSVATVEKLGGSVALQGLTSTVTIDFDPKDVLHISANTREDAAFGQGYAHAQLRMWQMEFQRRVGAGRISEVAGSAALSIDKFMRTLGVYRAAERTLAALSKDAQGVINAYVAGVNAYLNSNPPLPVTYDILGFKPEPWTAADSLVWAKLMALNLCGNMGHELERFYLYTRMGLSKERIDQLIPAYNITEFPTIISAQDIQGGGALPINEAGPSEAGAMSAMDAMQQAWMDAVAAMDKAISAAETKQPRAARRANVLNSQASIFGQCGLPGSADEPMSHIPANLRGHVRGIQTTAASNNWVVGGNRTASGKPLLCNDPHLQLMAPSIWILNHLKSPGIEAIGASFPGLPGVVIGHNNYISWAVTNTGADVQDMYIMHEQAGNDTAYWYKGGWHAYDIRYETLKIKGAAPLSLRIRESVYGPVMTDNDALASYSYQGPATLSLQWVSIMPSVADTTMDAFLGLNLAQSWNDFRTALQSYVAPSQNFIFADVNGNFGYQMPGRIPLRAANHNGAYPVPGNGTYDWGQTAAGMFIPFDSLPRTFNPSRGYVATANNRAVPANYKYLITVDWDEGADGFRAETISDMIEASTTHNVASMVGIQTNTLSHAALLYQPFAKALPASKLSPAGLAAQAALASWDCNMEVGSRPATLWAHWYRQLSTLAGPEVNATYWSSVIYIRNALRSDSMGMSDPACLRTHTSCLDFAADMLNVAADQATDGTGQVSQIPQWGTDVHLAVFQDQLLGNTPLGCLFNRKISHGGDYWTVNVGPFSFHDFHQDAGPSYRQIVDLASFENSKFLNPLGQSGNLFSPHYDDLLSDWSTGMYLNMQTTGYTAAVSETLQPATSAPSE